MRTRLYTVHIDPRAAHPEADAIFIRDGFCLAAAVFTVLWALYHRLWFAALMLLALSVGLGLVVELLEPDPLIDAAVGLGLFAWIGFEANDWRRAAFARRGRLEAGVVAARDLTEAERRFFAGGAAMASA